MQAVEQNLAQLKSEEALWAWIKNYAYIQGDRDRMGVCFLNGEYGKVWFGRNAGKRRMLLDGAVNLS